MNIFSRLMVGALMLAVALGAAPPAGFQPGQDPVVLLQPGDGAYLWPPEVTLRWELQPGVNTYLLTYISEAEPNVQQQITVEGSQVTLTLAPGVSYQWWVKAVAPILHDAPAPNIAPLPPGGLPQAQEERRVFTVSESALAPAPPRGLNPHTARYNDRIRLTWQPSFRAERYIVNRTGLFNGDAAVNLGETTLTEFEDLTASAGQAYRYSVRACNTAGCSEPVEAFSWLGMCRAELPVPELTSPTDGAQVTDSLYRMEWSAHPGISEYEVQVTDLNSQEVVLQQVSLLNYLPDVMLQGSLGWRVRALDPVIGCPAGAWSATATFLAQTPLPTALPDPAAPGLP